MREKLLGEGGCGERRYNLWLRRTCHFKESDGTVTVSAPNQFIGDWFLTGSEKTSDSRNPSPTLLDFTKGGRYSDGQQAPDTPLYWLAKAMANSGRMDNPKFDIKVDPSKFPKRPKGPVARPTKTGYSPVNAHDPKTPYNFEDDTTLIKHLGNENAISAIDELVKNALDRKLSQKPIIFIGPNGVGKSRMLSEAARNLALKGGRKPFYLNLNTLAANYREGNGETPEILRKAFGADGLLLDYQLGLTPQLAATTLIS